MTHYIILGVILLIAVLVVLYYLNNDKVLSPDEEESYSASIALLLAEHNDLAEVTLRETLSNGLDEDFTTDTDSSFIQTIIDGSQYMLKYKETLFLLHNISSPYFDDPEEVAASVEGDDILAKDVKDHKAWLSVASLGRDHSIDEQYDMIGAILSVLAPESTTALFFEELETLLKYDSERKKQLKGPKALKQLGFNSINDSVRN